jgi:hypothetical protein
MTRTGLKHRMSLVHVLIMNNNALTIRVLRLRGITQYLKHLASGSAQAKVCISLKGYFLGLDSKTHDMLGSVIQQDLGGWVFSEEDIREETLTKTDTLWHEYMREAGWSDLVGD